MDEIQCTLECYKMALLFSSPCGLVQKIIYPYPSRQDRVAIL